MTTYIAILWDASDSAQNAIAIDLKERTRRLRPAWCACFDNPGMFVSTEQHSGSHLDHVYRLAAGHGIILGTLFERAYVDNHAEIDESPKPVILGDSASARMVADGCTTLRDEYWGRYVAFLTAPARGRQWVFRDPTGQIPCQHGYVAGLSFYFSRLVDLEEIAPGPLRVNRHFLIGHLGPGSYSSGETAYEGITTVLPGERVEYVRGSRTTSFLWNAVQLANSNDSTTFSEARANTSRIVRRCVSAWASGVDRLSLQLSGGLDSSIVAACLATSPRKPSVLCFNFYRNEETADERVFAREVARRFQFELIECLEPPPPAIDLSTVRERTVVPTCTVPPSASWTKMHETLQSREITLHVRGDGGDELFYRDGAVPDAVDCAYYSGLNSRLWAIAMNDAMIERTSVWNILGLAIRLGLMRRRYDWRDSSWKSRLSLLCDDVRNEVLTDRTHWHPLYRGDVACAPGKLHQSHRLLYLTTRFHGFPLIPSDISIVSPLLSQPHMEFALRTPLSVLRDGARDRAAARAAFRESVPSRILNRKYKGLDAVPSGHWISGRAKEIRDVLLGGYLASERILDRHAIEAIFAKGHVLESETSHQLKAALDVEVWARNAIAHRSKSTEFAPHFTHIPMGPTLRSTVQTQ
jgi:asparagine synthase (glutamine-hydrolysing)